MDAYLLWLDKKLGDYSIIVTTRAIPNHDKPTTSNELKNLCTQDPVVFVLAIRSRVTATCTDRGKLLFFLIGYFHPEDVMEAKKIITVWGMNEQMVTGQI